MEPHRLKSVLLNAFSPKASNSQLSTVNSELGVLLMDDCLFCKIGKKEIPAKLVYEDAEIFAFEDIQPQAPNHILICPRKHLGSLTDATVEDAAMLGKLQLVAAKLAGRPQTDRRLPHRVEQRARRRPVRVSPAPASARRPRFSMAAGLSSTATLGCVPLLSAAKTTQPRVAVLKNRSRTDFFRSLFSLFAFDLLRR